MADPESPPPAARAFPPTSWSLICKLRDAGPGERDAHLERLIQLYWKPVECVIRHAWSKSSDDAKDLTQQFFLTTVLEGELVNGFAPERGSFRAFLKGALAHFLTSEARRQGRLKRGGGARHLSFAEDGVPLELGPAAARMTADQMFDAAWKRMVLVRALEQLEQKLRADGRDAALQVFHKYDLESSPATSYREIGQELGLTADQVKHALGEARGHFRDIVAHIVRGYVDGPEELTKELRHLLGG